MDSVSAYTGVHEGESPTWASNKLEKYICIPTIIPSCFNKIIILRFTIVPQPGGPIYSRQFFQKSFCKKDNKRSFWCFVRDQRNSKCPPAFQYADQLLHRPSAVAQAFNEFFTSVHSPPGSCSSMPPSCTLPIPELPPIQIELGWLTKSLQNLNPHKAPGPDGISPTVLRSTAPPSPRRYYP